MLKIIRIIGLDRLRGVTIKHRTATRTSSFNGCTVAITTTGQRMSSKARKGKTQDEQTNRR